MTSCPQCGNKFDEKTGRRPKKFCSDECKVKWWNEQRSVKKEDIADKKLKEEIAKDPEITQILEEINQTSRDQIENQIEALIKERDAAPKDYSTIGKKVWRNDRQKQIDELQKLLKK